jgi:hypothetical protein
MTGMMTFETQRRLLSAVRLSLQPLSALLLPLPPWLLLLQLPSVPLLPVLSPAAPLSQRLLFLRRGTPR